LGLQLTVYNASSESEIDMAFASVAERQTGALLVTADPFFEGKRDQIISWQHGTRCLHSILLASSSMMAA
jgi:hypothetical protein